MMKKVTYLLTVLFALALINLGCEKENPNPDDENSDVGLRISKMTDNIENTVLFQYNSDGLINKIDDGYHHRSIEYDEQNRPIKWSSVEYDRPESLQTHNIEWTDDGFIVYGDIYTLDDKGRISRISSQNDEGIIVHSEDYTYVGESKVTIERKDDSGEIYETFEIEFGSFYNPFRYFNVALTVLDYTVCPDDVPSHHSKYALSSTVDGSQSVTATYEVNEHNIPIKGTFNNAYYGSDEIYYYEYETD